MFKQCIICNSRYPESKHNFEKCYSLDIDWDLIVINTTAKPPLKWVGGKTQILHHIKKHLIGLSFDTYYEPFVGGGSVLLMILFMIENNIIHLNKIIASDINWQLICLYNSIKNTPYVLMDEIDRIYKKYENANVIEYKKRHKVIITTLKNAICKGKKYVYYYFRKRYNEIKKPCIEVAALFVILNKLCFRGLYRTGKNGFNAAYGNYTNPCIYDKHNIIKLSYLFNVHSVIFKHQSYESINPTNKDFVYIDPPYYPIRKKAFESYSKHGFDHDRLVKFTKQCKNFIHSNAWCGFIINNYLTYDCEKILCKRKINSKKPEDTDYEIMICNISKK